MERTPVSSSQIASIGYDPDQQILEVEFKGGGVYQYVDVPPETHAHLIGAQSVGQAFHSLIRGQFQFSKVA